ncbi:hypothetical protein GCM10023184_29530 [Flaviaesturariibacter amylovorans]|uniref:Uncharacterized protein n=1 Tax=Flaviaesturariibacter amylovorans TaxID=1084520 RepID=A0ABP8H6U6_9BACT
MSELFVPKYCDSSSILLVNSTGGLRKLYCPFLVKALYHVGSIKQGSQVWVERVACSRTWNLVYIIHGQAYAYTRFGILATV